MSKTHFSLKSLKDEVVDSITRNNHVALKGVIREPESTREGIESEDINMKLRRRLDLFANVVHIKTLDGIKTRHNKRLDFVIIREQTEGEYSRQEHELVPGKFFI
jgi:isocitrate dehydrogenase (NAD+)